MYRATMCPAPMCQAARMHDLTLHDGDRSFTLALEAGGRLASLVVDGLELVGRGGPGMFHWGSYVMAPYAGRIRRGGLTWQGRRHQLPVMLGAHAIHGVVLDRPWTLLDSAEGPDGARARVRCDFDNRWPWPGHVEAEYHLAGDTLTSRIAVHAADGPMPAWTGWHPWFPRTLSRGGPARIEFAAEGIWVKDAEGIQTGEVAPVPDGPYDDCFPRPTWPATITWDGALRLEVASDAENLVVYDELPDGVCVEPQTSPPDAVALDRHTLVEPGTPLTTWMTWTWSAA